MPQRSTLPDPADIRRQWFLLLLTHVALGVFFGVGALPQFLRQYAIGTREVASIYLCLLLLLGLFLAPGFEVTRGWLGRQLHGWRGLAVCIIAFLLPYLIYAAGTGDFGWTALGKLVALSAIPLGVFAIAPVPHPRRINWQDLLVMLWLVLPVLFRQTSGIWNVPVNLDFLARLFVVSLGAWSFLIWRGTDDVGYVFRFSSRTVRDAFLNFAGFTVIALPLGLALRFIAWNPQWRGPWAFIFDYLTIFLFIAIPEELFFRGLLQNLLEKTWESRYGAQAVASVLFGLSHIMHAPFPNWRYVILASVAGWFYGAAYRNKRSLMASSTTHALVDTVWRTWFTKIMQ